MSHLENQFYETATREVAERRLVPAVWGKAFSQALGDSQASLALYIRLRVEELQQEHELAARIGEREAEARRMQEPWRQQLAQERKKWERRILTIVVTAAFVAVVGFLIAGLVKSW